MKTTPSMISIPSGRLQQGISQVRAVALAGDIFRGTQTPFPESVFFSEVPDHPVNVPAFRIGSTEVTNAEYQQFVAAGGYADPRWWTALLTAKALNTHAVGMQRVAEFVDASGKPAAATWRNGTFAPGKEQHPVDGVSYFEACAFAAWHDVRLPTESEWEFAARGTDGREHVWGDVEVLDELVKRQTSTTAAGSMEADKSPFGVMDLARNVSEWVHDPWHHYAGSPLGAFKLDENTGTVRGGMYQSQADQVRATWRRKLDRLERRPGVGFRVASDA